MGILLWLHLSPSSSVWGNNAFGVTLCIVASWLCVAPLKQHVKIEYSCLGLCHRIARERVPQLSHSGTLVSLFGPRAAATISAQAELFCGPYRFSSVTLSLCE